MLIPQATASPPPNISYPKHIPTHTLTPAHSAFPVEYQKHHLLSGGLLSAIILHSHIYLNIVLNCELLEGRNPASTWILEQFLAENRYPRAVY
jgi:hypothetical protein